MQPIVNWSLVALLLGAALFYLKKEETFSLAAISSHRSFDPRFVPLSSPDEAELNQALEQPYVYLSSGGQSFVFASIDGRYVIKFFKQKHYEAPFYLDLLPPFFQDYKRRKREKCRDKLRRDLTSYVLAFDHFREESGLIYLHFNKTKDIKKQLLLEQQTIDLDRFDFVVQKRAVLAPDRLLSLMQQNHPEEAKKELLLLVELLAHRCKRGFHDRDPNILTNCGFIGETPILLDAGRISYRPELKQESAYQKEVVRALKPFQEWLDNNLPQLSHSLQEAYASYMD